MSDNAISSWLEGIRTPEPIETDDESDEYDSDDGVELLVRVFIDRYDQNDVADEDSSGQGAGQGEGQVAVVASTNGSGGRTPLAEATPTATTDDGGGTALPHPARSSQTAADDQIHSVFVQSGRLRIGGDPAAPQPRGAKYGREHGDHCTWLRVSSSKSLLHSP
jgi:hypothetical protein